MLYIGQNDYEKFVISWDEAINVVEEATICLNKGEYAQPLKPYLRFNDIDNRIIAMPAYIGGKFNIAGIKWIASFPKNIKKGILRAHSVVILNDAGTGMPLCIINTAELSALRTAAVSGCVLKHFLNRINKKQLKVGIIGFGPIGKKHLEMAMTILKNYEVHYYIFDIAKSIPYIMQVKEENKTVHIVQSWEEAFQECDVVITCTVSNHRYIDIAPRPGSLLLNVSLRDYKTDIYNHVKGGIIVDSWEEVCRENTDIELLSLKCGLQKKQVYTIEDIVCNELLENMDIKQTIMFNPMGMAIYDIAFGYYIWEKAQINNIGLLVD